MITEKLYKDCVNSIIAYNNKEREIHSATNGVIDLFNMEEMQNLISQFEQLLEYCTKDDNYEDYSTALSYFIYDLDGGKDYKEGCISEENGKNISCKNVDELWNNFIVVDHPDVVDNGDNK